MAGIVVRLCFGNETLRGKVTGAFVHLRAEDTLEPRLTVFVHEDASLLSGTALGAVAAGGENDLWLAESAELSVIAQHRGREISAIEWQRGTAYWLVPQAEGIPYIERAHPLQQLLIHWLGRQRRFFVHGAAVGNEHGGVLILGHGGAGKSTTALLSLEAGLQYAADDHCLVSQDDGPAVHSIYATGKVAFDELHRFPLLAPAADTVERPATEKAVLFLDRLASARLAPRLELRALLLARITDVPETRLRRVGGATAFKAILASSALHLPGERPQALECFNGLVRRLPAYVLELGADLRSTPVAIRELLDNREA